MRKWRPNRKLMQKQSIGAEERHYIMPSAQKLTILNIESGGGSAVVLSVVRYRGIAANIVCRGNAAAATEARRGREDSAEASMRISGENAPDAEERNNEKPTSCL